MSRRTFMRADLGAAVAGLGVPGLRPFDPSDEAALGPLLFDAYLGTVDQEEGTPDDARAEIRRTLAGEYGEFDADASRVMQRDGRLVSAALLTRFQQRPFVAFSITAPDCKNQGLARACLQAAMAALRARGERELGLVVTRANAPAVHLYRRLGFVEEPSLPMPNR